APVTARLLAVTVAPGATTLLPTTRWMQSTRPSWIIQISSIVWRTTCAPTQADCVALVAPLEQPEQPEQSELGSTAIGAPRKLVSSFPICMLPTAHLISSLSERTHSI